MMFNFLKKKNALDDDFLEWALDFSKWVIENFDGLQQIRNTRLALPTHDFFPPISEKGEIYATHIARCITHHADMSDWEYTLVSQAESSPHYIGSDIIQDKLEASPLGTFSVNKGNHKPVISYDPSLLTRPDRLIATLSHEFAHYLMTNTTMPPPGGWEMEEPSTDGLAIFMGFGVFIANTSFEFSIDQDSWGYERAGYLCEGEILHALAAFLHISGNEIGPAGKYLKPNLAKRLREIYAAMADIAEIQAWLQ